MAKAKHSKKKSKRRNKQAHCKKGMACGRGCIAYNRSCHTRPPYQCQYNSVIKVGMDALVLDATCQGERRAIKFSPLLEENDIRTHALLSKDGGGGCASMVVPLHHGYTGKGVKLRDLVPAKLPANARKRVRDVESQGAGQQIIIMDRYDVDGDSLILKRRAGKKNRVVGRTAKQLQAAYLRDCSHPSGYVHNDLHPRNVVFKQRTLADGSIEYSDARLIDFDKLVALPLDNPDARGRLLGKLRKKLRD